jgi:pimeloyl-ACP methyl ester carboxylesterase
MRKIYLIPGLGADARVFTRLRLHGPCLPVSWIPPAPREPLTDYCIRLAGSSGIEAGQVLIGVSFGGLIAQELARITRARTVILISSVKNRGELPFLFRLAGRLSLQSLLPYQHMKRPNPLLRYAFGPLSEADYALLKPIIAQTDVDFLKWAIYCILHWRPAAPSTSVIHLHGTADRTFPGKRLKDYIPVSSGGHFMIVNRAEEISTLINRALQDQ